MVVVRRSDGVRWSDVVCRSDVASGKDGDLEVMYVRSEDNPADIMTKNTKEALYIKHATAMKKGVLVLGQRNREDVVVVVRWLDEV